MKKEFLAITAINILLLTACKKQDCPTPSESIDISGKYSMSVKNDMLTFAGKQTYYNLINDVTDKDKADFIKSSLRKFKFNALLNSGPEGSALLQQINDDFFSSILNNNGCVQIGEYIYKIDPEAEVVYVIPSAKPELSRQSNAGLTSTQIVRKFGMDNNVIEMAEEATHTNSLSLFCTESGAGSAEASKHVDLKNPQNQTNCNWFDAWVSYNRFGIYFSLKASFINQCPSRVIYWHKTPVAYKVKCGSSYGPVYQWDIPTAAITGSTWNQYFYQGIQPLNAYWLRVVFMAKDINWIGNPDNPSADLEIRKNM